MTSLDEVLYSSSASDALAGDKTPDDELIVSPKQLIWDMLAVCYSDESIDDAEREVLNHVAKHYGVGDVLVRELEHAILALADLDREERWVKSTERPYLTIEAEVTEIERRKAAVLEGVQALITL